MTLKDRCEELQGELSVQTDGNDIISVDFKSRLCRLEEDLRVTRTDLRESNRNLAEARVQIESLTGDLTTAENKYTHEMLLHSNDLQVSTKFRFF